MRRTKAYQILKEVYFNQRHAHLVLKEQDMDPQDQAFVSALVYTTLQNDAYLQYQFEEFVDKKLPKEVVLVLKMAAAQYYKMDAIPPYALVNEYVELTKRVRLNRYAGVVNAVLKNMISRPLRQVGGSPIEQAEILYSMPAWIMKLLSAQYGENYAIDYAKYCSEIKPNYIRINQLKPIPVDTNLMTVTENGLIAKADLFQSDLLDLGHVVVQDINSQKVVQLMDIKPGDEVLDVCCGPGTKTQLIGEKISNQGRITGVELIDIRAQKTREFLERTGVTNAEVIEADAQSIEMNQEFDAILLDVPCSGLGVLSHKHDLRYHILPSDLDALQVIQANILQHMSQFLKSGGSLVYATCTLNRKENERQIMNFLENNPDEFVLEEEVTTNPMETQGDGFYMARLRKVMKETD